MTADDTTAAPPDWSQPCPAPTRCANQRYCPSACRKAGNREGNVHHYPTEADRG